MSSPQGDEVIARELGPEVATVCQGQSDKRRPTEPKRALERSAMAHG